MSTYINILKRDIRAELEYVRDFDIREFQYPWELFACLSDALLRDHVYSKYALEAVQQVFHEMHIMASCLDNDQLN